MNVQLEFGASGDRRPSRAFGLHGIFVFCVVRTEEQLLPAQGFKVVKGLSPGLVAGSAWCSHTHTADSQSVCIGHGRRASSFCTILITLSEEPQHHVHIKGEIFKVISLTTQHIWKAHLELRDNELITRTSPQLKGTLKFRHTIGS